MKMENTVKIDPRGGSNRYSFKTDFFQKWSSEMAYVLGFLYADGNVTDAAKSSRTQYIQFASKARDILVDIKKALESDHFIYCRSPRWVRHFDGKLYRSSEFFVLRIGSKKMFYDLEKIGLVPNKSKIIRFPRVPKKYLNHFIRGYFDGDGCVYVRKECKRLDIVFTSGSEGFLEDLNSKIKDNVGLDQKRVYYNHRAYQLRYATKDSVELFKFLYKNTSKGTYLKRKANIFSKYFQKKPLKIDRTIKKMLNNPNMAWYPSS